jgi:hypothetical protein
MPIITGGGTITFVVEVCFNQAPNDPAPPTAVWTDITQRCSNIRWSRGRQYELDKVETGTFSATVDNLDGALTPGNTASAFYPNVVLYRQIRVTATISSTTYTLFFGYVSRWPQAYTQAGQRASTSIEAVDALGVLAQVTLRGWGLDAMTTYSPRAVYPLDDATGSTRFGATAGAFPSGVITASAPGAEALVVAGNGYDAAMPGFAGTTFTTFENTVGALPGATITLPNTVLPTSGAWTMAVWFNTGTPVGVTSPFLVDARVWGGTGSFFSIYFDGSGNPAVQVRDSTSGLSIFPAPLATSCTDGRWHLFAVSISADHKKITAVLDNGTPVSLYSGATVLTLADLPQVQLGGLVEASVSPFSYFQGSMGPFSVFNSDLCSDTTNNPIQTFYAAGTQAFALESTDTRANRIATVTGFGSRFLATGTGDSTMSAGATSGQAASDALSDVAATEFGMIFARGDGIVVFTPRHARYNPSPAYAFGELELPYSALSFDYDSSHLVNSATVTRPGGASTTVTDATSVATNFTHSQSYALQLSSDFSVRAAAEWLVSRYKDPKLRVSSFTVKPLANSDLIPAALNIELNTCVRLTRRPVGAQAITQVCFVDRLEHKLTFDSSGGSWTVDYMLTPAETTSYLVWDGAGVFGKWDSNNWAY